VLRKVTKQIILSAITWHVQDNQVIRPSQQGFMKGRSCFTIMITFYDKMTGLVDEGRLSMLFTSTLAKPLTSVSHSILPEKLAAHFLDGCTLLAGWLGPKSWEWS